MTEDDAWTLTDWDPEVGFHCFLCKLNAGPFPTPGEAQAAARRHDRNAHDRYVRARQ